MGQRKINKIVVHCSDTPNGKDFTVIDINNWHRERGFKESSNGRYCGYHWIVRVGGIIEMGRDESDVGAHSYGDNRDSIGICLIGRDKFSKAQLVSMYYLLSEICMKYDLEAKQVFGHYEMSSGRKQGKTCPNMNMEEVRNNLEQELQGGGLCKT